MPLDAILEIAIGLVMTWLVVSVVTMEIQNWMSQALNTRAKFLQESLLTMFRNEQVLVERFYEHPAIKELGTFDRKGNYKKPTYIPNDVFAKVAMELLMGTREQTAFIAPESVSLNEMSERIKQIQSLNADLKDLVDYIFPGIEKIDQASPDIHQVRVKLEQYRENLEKWFDNNMEKASIWYKQNAATTAFFIGLALALFFNVDTVNVIQRLWREPTIRQALVAQAGTYQLGQGIDNIAQVPGYFDSLAMPVGWTSVPATELSTCTNAVNVTPQGQIAYRAGTDCRTLVNIPATYDVTGWVIKILGLIATAFAARQGAPFWFDLLRKLVSLRESTQAPKKEEAKG
jgi:hypothetical protein